MVRNGNHKYVACESLLCSLLITTSLTCMRLCLPNLVSWVIDILCLFNFYIKCLHFSRSFFSWTTCSLFTKTWILLLLWARPILLQTFYFSLVRRDKLIVKRASYRPSLLYCQQFVRASKDWKSNRITVFSSRFASESVAKRIESRVSRRYFYTHVCSSIVHKSQKGGNNPRVDHCMTR